MASTLSSMPKVFRVKINLELEPANQSVTRFQSDHRSSELQRRLGLRETGVGARNYCENNQLAQQGGHKDDI